MHGKVVLITGGAKRVGAAICRRLHAAGANLMLHYRASAGEARLLQAELNHARAKSVALIQADLLDIAKLPSLVEQTLATFGRLDALVNNASSFFPTPIGEITPARWDDLIGTNLRAPTVPRAGGRAGAAASAQGAIVNITDIHAERPLKGYVVYSLAKAGLVGPHALARARARAGSARERGRARADPVARRRIVRRAVAPAHHFAHAAEARRHAGRHRARRAFPAGGRAYVTGETIDVDGGRHIAI